METSSNSSPEENASHPHHNIKLRPATMDDAEMLLQWRSDPDSIKNSLKQSPPPSLDHHKAWLQAVIDSPTVDMVIATVGDTAVGTVRLERGVVSITIAPEHRGHGHGSSMLRELCERYKDRVLTAAIRGHNIASQRIFEKNGFHVTYIMTDQQNAGIVLFYARPSCPSL